MSVDVGLRVSLDGSEEVKREVGAITNEIAKLEAKLKEITQRSTKGLTGATVDEYRAVAEQLKALREQATGAATSTADTTKSLYDLMGGGRAAMESVGNLRLVAGAAATVIGAGLGVAVGYAATELYGAVQAVRTLGDHLNNLSQQTGIAVEKLSGGLRLAAETSGTSVDGLALGMRQLNRAISEAADGTGRQADAFKRLGITVKDSSGNLKSADQVLGELADVFKGSADGATKTELAMALLGRAGVNLIPTLNQGSQAFRNFQTEAERAGIVMSKETAEAASKLNENLRVLAAYGEGFWMQVATPFVEGLKRITDEMREASKEGGLLAQVWAGIKQAALEVAGAVPQKQLANTIELLSELEQRLIERRGNAAATGAENNPQFRRGIAVLEQRIAEVRAERDKYAAQVAAARSASGIQDLGEFGFDPKKPQLPSPTPKEGKTGKATVMTEEQEAADELRRLKELLDAEELARADYLVELRILEQDFSDWFGESSSARLKITAARIAEEKKLEAEANREDKERITKDLKDANIAAKAEVDLAEITAKETQEAWKFYFQGQERDRQRDLRGWEESARDRLQLINDNIFATEREKAASIRAIARELDQFKAAESEKKEITNRQAELNRQARAIEVRESNKFYSDLSAGLTTHLTKILKGHETFGEGLIGVWKGFLDHILNSVVKTFADSVVDALRAPLLDPIKTLFDSILGVVGSSVKNLLGGLFEFHTGSPEVDYTQLAVLRAGEAVIPAEYNPFTQFRDQVLAGVKELLGFGGVSPTTAAEVVHLQNLAAAELELLGGGQTLVGAGAVGAGTTLGGAAQGAFFADLGIGGAGAAGFSWAGLAAGLGGIAAVMTAVNFLFGDDGPDIVNPTALGVYTFPDQAYLGAQNFPWSPLWDELNKKLFYDAGHGGYQGFYDLAKLRRVNPGLVAMGYDAMDPAKSFLPILAAIDSARVKEFPVEWFKDWRERGKAEGLAARRATEAYQAEQEWQREQHRIEYERAFGADIATTPGGFASGTDSIFASPTRILVGEAGAERVTVSPLAGAAHGRKGDGDVNINVLGHVITDQFTWRQFTRSLRRELARA